MNYTDYINDKKKLKYYLMKKKIPNKKEKKRKEKKNVRTAFDQIKRINKGAKKLFEEYYKKYVKSVVKK